MPATITPQPVASTGVQAGDVAVGTNNQLARVGQATRTGGGQLGPCRTITANDFLASTDTFVFADVSGGSVQLTLPLLSEYSSLFAFVRQQVSGAGNSFTVVPNPGGSDTIDGNASLTVTKMVMLVRYNNQKWTAVVIEN